MCAVPFSFVDVNSVSAEPAPSPGAGMFFYTILQNTEKEKYGWSERCVYERKTKSFPPSGKTHTTIVLSDVTDMLVVGLDFRSRGHSLQVWHNVCDGENPGSANACRDA